MEKPYLTYPNKKNSSNVFCSLYNNNDLHNTQNMNNIIKLSFIK